MESLSSFTKIVTSFTSYYKRKGSKGRKIVSSGGFLTRHLELHGNEITTQMGLWVDASFNK